MYDSKLIQTYIALNTTELRKLRKFFKSNFVNKNEEINALFNFIESRSVINEKTVSKTKVHEYIFDNKPYNDLKIRHLIWQTNAIMESFIIQHQCTDDVVLKNQLLSKFYIEKELFKYAKEIVVENIDLIVTNNKRNANYHYHLYKANADLFNISQRNIRSNQLNIKQITNHASLFTIIEILKYGCLIRSIQKLNTFDFEDLFIRNIIQFLPNSEYIKNPIVRIYYHDYLLITEDSEMAFKKLEQDLKEYQSLFKQQEFNELYANLINYCVKRTNQNDEAYTKKAFKLYLDGVKNGVFLENNEINRFVFTNIVTLGIKVKSYKIIEQFIATYYSYIDIEYRQNTFDFNQAKLHYAKQEYKAALQILLTNEFKDLLWNLNAKYIVLKIFFEQKELDLFSNHLIAYKAYIKRKKNIGYHATYFKSIEKNLTLLLKVAKKPEKYIHYTFDESVADKTWFNKALEQILKKQKSIKS